MRKLWLVISLALLLGIPREASAVSGYTSYLPVLQRSSPFAACIPSSSPVESGVVTSVIDGDTIVAVIGGVEQRVRYIGIDTPEISGELEAFGPEASARNRQLVEGKHITLRKDQRETDVYGRLLRFVYAGDTFVNQQLVAEGLAENYPYSPDLSCADLFAQAEEAARASKLGMWSVLPTAEPSTCDCYGPDLDCSDFSTHTSAQSCFDSCASLGLGDVFKLDANDDGQACETLP